MTGIQQFKLPSAEQLDQNRFKLFLGSFLTMLLVLPIGLLIVGQFSIRSYFILGFILFLTLSEIFAPAERMSDWWGWLQLVKLVGWIGVIYIILERVLVVVA